MAQTLDGAAQIARIIQVSDPSQAHPRILIRFARLIPLFDDFNSLALLFMESQVSVLTLLAAVVDLAALAVKF